MDKRRRNYQLFIEEGYRTFDQVQAGVPAGAMLRIEPPFTMEFDIIRNDLASSNTATFRVYNLTKTTRTKIHKDQFATNLYKGIELRAGYENVTPTIFKGNIKIAWSTREGQVNITKIEAYDGGFAFLNGRVDQSFQAGTPNNQVLEAIMQTLPQVNRGAVGNFPGVLTRGNAISGNSADLASQLSNGSFFVDLEKAYVLNDNECIPGAINVIASDSGLLGTPILEETSLRFDMIFEPRLLIGQQVKLDSLTATNFNTVYRVCSLQHRGMISDSVCGTAITSVGLWYGTKRLEVVT